MTVFLSNRDGNGKTNEEGHYRLQTRVYSGFNLLADDLKVTEQSPLALGVLVSAGDYRIETSAGYSYTGWIDAPTPVTIPTANASNPRISSIVIYVDKGAATTASPPNNPGIAKLLAVQGTAAASPVAPSGSAVQAAVGAGNPYYVIANVTVGTAATQVTNSNITDLRQKMRLVSDILSYADIYNNISNLIYPIGSIYTNAVDPSNPATILGFGTWVAFGQGRVAVGVNAADSQFSSVGATGGVKEVALTNAQLPNHTHVIDPPAVGTSASGNHNHRIMIYNGNNGNRGGGDISGANWPSNQQANYSTTDAGNHAHTVDIPPFTSGGSGGGGQAHTNLQPYVTVFMWRRTA